MSISTLAARNGLNGQTLRKQYKETISDYRIWDQLEHAEEYILYPEFFNMFSCLRSFFKELVANGVITSSPFQKYHGIVSENYGTPYYITLDERNIIADHDFSKSPSDALQRDIFIFQTLIGCRVSDLYRMTPKNIINGAIEYIASKTLNSRAKVIRVPLNQRGLEILDRYKGQDPEGRIFPFISQQKSLVSTKKS